MMDAASPPIPAEEQNPIVMEEDNYAASETSSGELESSSPLEEAASAQALEDSSRSAVEAMKEWAEDEEVASEGAAVEAADDAMDAADADEDEQVPSEGTAVEAADDAVDAADAAEDEQVEPPESAPEDVEQIDDGRAWFVVHSYSGYENKVKNNLEHRIESMNMQDKIFKVVVPTEEEIEIKEGHRRKTKRRVFPGYILVQMLMDEESWYVVRNTPGVTGFVGSGSRPTPLRPEEASKIFDRMRMEAPKIKVSFREGQTVRIVDGPFVDFVGVVEDLNLDKGKVTVMVSFFGRETPVELDFLQVQRQ